MNWERRTFLKTLLALGVSQSSLGLLQAKGYAQTLATPTQGKLALLVGINNYGESGTLKGCETDVELQRDLLIHRFGFQGANIVLLTGKQATRKNIETAFLEHLVAQAKPTDVVVFHFSGYGTQISIPTAVAPLKEAKMRGFVPQDGRENTLLALTLNLFGRSLATDKITLVFDTSHQKPQERLQSNSRLRTFPQEIKSLNPEEIALQDQLERQIKASPSRAKSAGMSLTAAGKNQIAREITSNGFSAGLFTYSLTQYLWQITPASKIIFTLNRVREKIAPIVGEQQQPQGSLEDKPPLFTYALLPQTLEGAEGVITKLLDGNRAELQLTGLPLEVIENYGINSCFRLISGESQPLNPSTNLLQLRSRLGLKAKAQWLNPLETSPSEGQLIEEAIRIFPRNLGLTVALSSQLERIERVDATSAFASIPLVTAVVNPGEQAADCVLGKITETVTEIPEIQTTYGLFSVGGVLLTNTIGTANEAIQSAVKRLTPNFEELLAVKFRGLTLNEGSSRLPVRVTLERCETSPQPLIQRYTRGQRGATSLETTEMATLGIPALKRGSQIQYRLENFSDRPLYFLVLGRDSKGKTFIFSPAPDNNAPIAPKETRLIPAQGDSLTWIISGSRGLTQVQVIISQASFSQTLAAIDAQESPKLNKADILPLSNPLEIAQALLQDLHLASAVSGEILGTITDSYILDVSAWATLNFVYRVV